MNNHSPSSLAFPLGKRRSNFLLLSCLFILFCIGSLSFFAFNQLLTPTLAPSSLNLVQFKSSAKQLSSNLRNWYSDHYQSFVSFSSSNYSSSRPTPQSPHPILPLLLNSRQSWKSILRSQPLTLKQARQDYESKFHLLLPPPGYDQWYHFARRRNFTLINRFDGLMSDLEPYRKLTPAELIRRTHELVQVPGITLIRFNSASNVEISTQTGRLSPGNAIKQMIDRIYSQTDFRFPPMDIAINESPEARVLPRQTRPINSPEFSYLSDSDKQLYESQDPEKTPSLAGFKPQWGQDGSVWDAYRRACPPDSGARRLVETVRSDESQTGAIAAGGGLSSMSSTQTHLSLNRPTRLRALQPIGTAPLPSLREMTYLAQLESAVSFCERPSTHHLHSAFFDDQRSIEHLYPLFSPSKPQGFADILIPSYYHYSPRAEFVYESDLKAGRNSTPTDLPWNQKANKIYWHGKLTRGADTPPGHMSSFQKQRLVKLVSNDTSSDSSLTSAAHKQGETDPSWRSELSRVLVSLNVTSESLISVSSPATIVDPLLLDIAMACDPKAGECHELNKQGYHTQPPAPFSEFWKAKMSLDLDDVGFSPRFGGLMESYSALVKMSVHREFWADWVQPWYHFIPLSSSYAELHNMITFFLGIPNELKYKIMPIEEGPNQKEIEKRSTIPEPNDTPQPIEQQHQAVDPKKFEGRVTSPETHRKKKHRQSNKKVKYGLEGFDGDDELRKIGENGRDWKLRHLRQEDMEVYLFRLLIEWARILNPEITPSPTAAST